MNIDTLYRPVLVKSQGIIGSEENPDAAKNSNWAVHKFLRAYGEFDSYFRHLAKENTLQLYITQRDFITSSSCLANARTGYKVFVFDIRNHQYFSSVQPIKVRFVCRPPVPVAPNLPEYALLLANKEISISSDGIKQFDFV